MVHELTLPASEEAIRALRVGDAVRLSGRLCTAREAAHQHLARADDPKARALLRGRVLYHCAPVVVSDPGTRAWRVVAAGPTESARVEAWTPAVVAGYGVRGLLGKGGMGPATGEALAAHGAVYLHAPPDLAVTLARSVVKVHGVHLLDELGVAEALWDLEVRGLPAVVTMDAHGANLHLQQTAP
ncbi:MAG: fumarate hydratase C-terminal domain-containing protein [Anaeromyxobacteraceae bacterium]